MTAQKPLHAAARPDSFDECQVALNAAQQENATLRDKYLRAAAALDNARKQAERDAEQRLNQRLRGLYSRLIEISDNLERALSYATKDDALAPGILATLEEFHKVLQREGVMRMDVKPGVPFDPVYHEAVETREGNVGEIIVTEVAQPGYIFESQVLRPARVVVTRPADADT